MYFVVLTKTAVKDAKKLKAAGLDVKAKSLIAVVRKDPFGYPPSFEPLAGDWSGLYSRRISRQHRFVYEVNGGPVTVNGVDYEGTVRILAMWSHYESL